jgi:hypothetical protein
VPETLSRQFPKWFERDAPFAVLGHERTNPRPLVFAGEVKKERVLGGRGAGEIKKGIIRLTPAPFCAIISPIKKAGHEQNNRFNVRTFRDVS